MEKNEPEYLFVRLDPFMKRALKLAAEESERTLSRLTRRIIDDWLKEHDYYKQSKKRKGSSQRGA